MTIDGLGFEEVNQDVTNTGIVVATTISGGNSNLSGNLTAGSSLQLNYSNNNGTKIINLVAEAIISGGMWVVGSAASGTSVSPVLKPAPANTGQPLGICLANVASGAAASVLVQGFYHGLIAEASLSQGVGVSCGAGGSLKTAKAAAAGTTRGTVVMGAGSEGVIGVYLW